MAGLPAEPEPGTRVALIEGSSIGAMAELLSGYRARMQRSDGRRRPPPSAVVRFMPGAGGAAFALSHRLRGPVLHLSAGSVSATCAIGEALARIASGCADVVVAGGAESPRHQEIVDAFATAGVLCSGSCRPFDERRDGTVLGEGAGAFVLESDEHARRRGAEPLAILTGYGFVCEAHSLTAPEPGGSGVTAAVTQALDGRPRAVSWIKAHGTGTPVNDLAECRGLAAVFGDRLADVPLAGLKPCLGHCLGASGAVEGVGAVMALRAGLVPPTLGTGAVDPRLPPCRVASAPERAGPGEVLLVSESFGGRCAALTLAAA